MWEVVVIIFFCFDGINFLNCKLKFDKYFVRYLIREVDKVINIGCKGKDLLLISFVYCLKLFSVNFGIYIG